MIPVKESLVPLLIAAGLYGLAIVVLYGMKLLFVKIWQKNLDIPYDRLPIIIALILLALCPIFLISKNEVKANDCAIMAYYLLVAGVVIQLIGYVRERKSGNKKG